MLEIHLTQPGYTDGAYGWFAKNQRTDTKIWKTGGKRYTY